MWWDTPQIESSVTRQFVCSHLLPKEIETLDRSLAFGDGLTDGTYWEWIDEKAKRIFLILVDLGVPDQIFGLIDDSWDDDDLPIALDQVERLALTYTKDDKVDKKFYYRQFHYLIKYLGQGDHVVYQDAEVVPVGVVDKKPGSSNVIDKVELPNRPGEVLSRRRVALGTGPGLLPYEEFLYEIGTTKTLQNNHIVSYFGSYTHQGYGYVLFGPTSDFNLKSLLVTMPASVKSIEKQDRRLMIMNWIHCLVDTLCYIHNRGRSHGNIKPSTILFNSDKHIFYADMTRVSVETLAHASDRSAFDKESYDYAAPEQWYRPSASQSGSGRKNALTSPTTSPENSPFSISRGTTEANNLASANSSPTPHLNPQAADIFSLGCVVLEMLTFQLKRQTKAFASHRAAKHKSPGRGGAVLDSSFHKNIGQVESWMASLAKDASKKDDRVFKGVAPMLQVVARMLAVQPQDRPTALEVEQRMYMILTESCNISEPHCVHQYSGWDFGMSHLRIGNVIEGQRFPIPKKRPTSGGSISDTQSRAGSSGKGRESPYPTSSAGSTSSAQASQSTRNKMRAWSSGAQADATMPPQTGVVRSL